MTDASNFNQQTTVQTAIMPLLLSSAVVTYDFLIERKDISRALYDGGISFGSLYLTKLAHSLIDTKIIDEFGNSSIQNMSYLVQPAINAFLYEYLYNMFYSGKFAFENNTRTKTMSMIIGGVLAGVQGFSDGIVVNWLSNMTKLF